MYVVRGKYKMPDNKVIFNINLSPIEISLFQLSSQLPAWESELQLIFISEGQVHFRVDNSTYHLRENDIIIIVPMEVYSFSEGDDIYCYCEKSEHTGAFL